MTTPNKCALTTLSELQEEMESFTRGAMSVRHIPDYTYAFRLPLIFTNGWQVEIYAQDEGDGTFALYGYDKEDRSLLYPDEENTKEKEMIKVFEGLNIEETDFGYTVFCTREDLIKKVYLFGIFLQTLSFVLLINEEATK